MPEFDDLLKRLDEAHVEEQKFNRETYGEREFDPEEETLYSESIRALTALRTLEETGEYEYAMLCAYRDKVGANPIQENEWTTRSEAEKTLVLFTTGEGGEFYKDRFKFSLVKRRKAGKVEIV